MKRKKMIKKLEKYACRSANFLDVLDRHPKLGFVPSFKTMEIIDEEKNRRKDSMSCPLRKLKTNCRPTCEKNVPMISNKKTWNTIVERVLTEIETPDKHVIAKKIAKLEGKHKLDKHMKKAQSKEEKNK